MLVAAFMAACVHVPGLAGAQSASAPETDSATVLLDLVLRLDRAESALRGIWPGFWPPTHAYVLTRKGRDAIAVSAGPPAPGFAPVPSVRLRSGARVYYHSGRIGHVGADAGLSLDFPFGDRTATVVAIDSSSFVTLMSLVHESFHTWQMDRFASLNAFDERLSEDEEPGPAFAATAENERRLLIDALRARTRDEMRTQLMRYLASRRARLCAAPAHVRAVERQMERKEGVAHYVGLRGAFSAMELSSPQLVDTLAMQLQEPLERIGQVGRGGILFGDASTPLMRWRMYAVGGAVVHLLEEMNLAWRADVERSLAPSDVLALRLTGSRPDSSTCEAR
jgi:hypothetical protein